MALHAEHAAPPLPHNAAVKVVMHVLPLQQPVGQLVESHTQLLPLQRWPTAHSPLPPQLQAPFEQRSARPAAHVVHAPPPMPQVAGAGLLQVLPVQQPAPQLIASQMHAPAEQRRPAPQGAFVPHRHAPPAQLSARVGLQLVHAAPPLPHAAAVCAPLPTHVLPLQQPPSQLAAVQLLHAWPRQVEPPVHAAHVAPRLPQEAFEVPGWQRLPLQQPVGQLDESQTQVPPTQR